MENKFRINVLIVDDEQEIRDVLREYLEAEGFTVLEASSGEMALMILKSERVNVVISDLVMPGMGGLILLQKIRALYGDLLPVVVCSAKFDLGNIDSKLKLTVHEIHKPFDESSFVKSFLKILNEL
jgi:CheY-like chemotaxis protein